MLTRLAVEWSSALVGARLSALQQESSDRFRLAFEGEGGDTTLIVCLDPVLPWMGREVFRWKGPRWSADPFTQQAAHALVGRRLERVSKQPADRSVCFGFGDGQGLAIELNPHGANLVLLGEGQTVVAPFRRSKRGLERLAPGLHWTPRKFPAGRLDPFRADADALDEVIGPRVAAGEPVVEVLRRQLLGVSAVGADLVVEEHLASGRSLGDVLCARLDELLAGTSEVLLEGPDEPERCRLLPWRPVAGRFETRLHGRGGPAEIAASFHEAFSRAVRAQERISVLGRIIRAELNRVQAAESKVGDGLRSFADPERHRLMGEALLASLRTARRRGDVVLVSDPYDPDGRDVSIPAAPGKPLAQVANELFEKQRRAKRGLATATARLEALKERSLRLSTLLVLHERTLDEAATEVLESRMRDEGLAVGLVGPTRAARAAAKTMAPRLDGVRMVTSVDGWTILVGRTARDNDRLTFKLAAPDDIWLHASGVSGAHVVIRVPDRQAPLPQGTLTEAAQTALWFSDGRTDSVGDVQWTRRKYVRRAKGGPAGRVVLKRFETIRVHAKPPARST